VISVSEWIELMKMLSDPNNVINSNGYEKVRDDVERFAMEFHPRGGSGTRMLQGGECG